MNSPLKKLPRALDIKDEVPVSKSIPTMIITKLISLINARLFPGNLFSIKPIEPVKLYICSVNITPKMPVIITSIPQIIVMVLF